MSDKSEIEWTDATWNPVRGCVKVSPGCKHCYAETFAERWRGIAGHPYEQGFDLRLVPEKLDEPLRWKKPRTIFVNSMSDLFQDTIPESFVLDVIEVMRKSHGLGHVFQTLTKRAERMRDVLSRLAFDAHAARDGRHIYTGPERIGSFAYAMIQCWWGVSVEDRRFGLPRIEHLRQTPAAVRFLSIEPLLEDLGTIDLTGIHWVIVGGESGLGAREMKAEWVRSIRDQCVAAKVPFFFKQWGGVRKKVKGRILDGRTWDEMPARVAS